MTKNRNLEEHMTTYQNINFKTNNNRKSTNTNDKITEI